MTRWLRLALALLMVFGIIGAWEVVKLVRSGGSAYADGVVADHLTCYDVKAARGAAIDAKAVVQLRDQFNPTGVEAEVRHLRLLCTAAIKTLR